MKRITIIAGPTASGKTARALAWAEREGAEIVSADSQQVYRHFDLGTAKPTPEEQARVRHHLLSFVDPRQGFSAAQFVRHADAAIADIQARGKPVLVVGGTGLYIRALLHGVVTLPPVDPSLRAQLEADATARGAPVLHAELVEVDPESAARIAPTDALRIVRAWEIYRQTGKPASKIRGAHGFTENRYAYDLHVLVPEKAALHAAIAARTRSLFARGLVQETRELVASGFRDTPPMRSVGYRQALEVVEGRWTEAQAIEDTERETRRYAKRQKTWFQRERGATPLP